MTNGFAPGTVHASATNPNAPAARRRRLSREVRESLLPHAALDQFVECGLAASRMEDIAARAGMAKVTPYLYSSSRKAVATTLCYLNRLHLPSRVRVFIDPMATAIRALDLDCVNDAPMTPG